MAEPRQNRIRVVAETGSTNADLRARVSDWPEGAWLRAERQNAGRGRLGRAWQSPPGNLYASTLIRLRADDPPVASLGLMLGVAVHSALTGLMPHAPILLKWPNDLIVGSAKLAGMLLEREGACVVAGVGVNVAFAPLLPDRDTIALADLAGGDNIKAEYLLEVLADALDLWLACWRREGSDAIISAWLERAHPIGTVLAVSSGKDAVQRGRFCGLNEQGALILEREDGTSQLVHSGDVGILP